MNIRHAARRVAASMAAVAAVGAFSVQYLSAFEGLLQVVDALVSFVVIMLGAWPAHAELVFFVGERR